jgi:hypothetical protein
MEGAIGCVMGIPRFYVGLLELSAFDVPLSDTERCVWPMLVKMYPTLLWSGVARWRAALIYASEQRAGADLTFFFCQLEPFSF